jgi:hypothetical protein
VIAHISLVVASRMACMQCALALGGEKSICVLSLTGTNISERKETTWWQLERQLPPSMANLARHGLDEQPRHAMPMGCGVPVWAPAPQYD